MDNFGGSRTGMQKTVTEAGPLHRSCMERRVLTYTEFIPMSLLGSR